MHRKVVAQMRPELRSPLAQAGAHFSMGKKLETLPPSLEVEEEKLTSLSYVVKMETKLPE